MKIYINYDFENWNKYINAERTNKFIGASIKKKETELVMLLTKNIPKIKQYPIKIKFKKYIGRTNTDVDNIRVKSILDGLVKNGIIIDDSYKYIKEITIKAELSKTKRGIEFEIEEATDGL